MSFNFKPTVFAFFLVFFSVYTTTIFSQSSCCGGSKKEKVACTTDDKETNKKVSCDTTKENTKATSGCLPSSCRGAKTKFGEAKVISNLRKNLIAIKAKMEASKSPRFDAHSYDIHGIVGKTDDESLQIIVREVKLIEKEFSNKTKFKPLAFALPENKAKQIIYLEDRLNSIKKFL